MEEQLQRIIAKLEKLGAKDIDNCIFGARQHQYRPNPTISREKIEIFEARHNITLPKEYADFLTNVGNGGVGPFYGLEPLKNVLFDDLDYKRPESTLDPSKPFLLREAWNPKFKPTVSIEENEEEYYNQLSTFEQEYFSNEHMNGTIAICNFGCGVSLHLVVNGEEYGNIWTNNRSSDYGIHPSCELGNTEKIGFLDWYELWLDSSLILLGVDLSKIEIWQPEPIKNEPEVKKPWWKIW